MPQPAAAAATSGASVASVASTATSSSSSGKQPSKSELMNEKILQAPVVQLAVRNRTHVQFLDIPKSTVDAGTNSTNGTTAVATTPAVTLKIHHTLPCNNGVQYNHNGTQVAVITATAVDIYSITHTPPSTHPYEYQLVYRINRPNVISVQYSPRSTHLSIWSVRGSVDIAENLLVYDLTGAAAAADSPVDSVSPPTPTLRHRYSHKLEFKWSENPPIQWTADDALMFVQEKHTIFCYEKATAAQQQQHEQKQNVDNATTNHAVDLSRWKHKLHLERLTTFAVNSYRPSSAMSYTAAPSSSNVYIATFTPQHIAVPAKLSIYKYSNFDTPVASKQFYKAEEAIIRFNTSGTKLLCQNATLTDRTGKSYYGESQLHCMSVDGKLNATVPNSQGPIQDFRWHTAGQNSEEFLVLQGFQPAKGVLYNTTDTDIAPLRDYGHASRSTIVFSPHGRYVALSGFGNLAGGKCSTAHCPHRACQNPFAEKAVH